ncbi:inorganic diphosphatase [Pseudomonadota bacterium]
MALDKISMGSNPPEEVNVIIEVPMNSDPVKYEIDKKSGILFVDRFISTPMYYPCNYGFIPNTLSDDGDPVDVLVVSEFKVQAGAIIPAKPVGVFIMEDEKGMDEKIIAVPTEDMNSEYSGLNELKEIPIVVLNRIKHFFERYKDLEKGKWVKVKHFEGRKEALQIIQEAVARAKMASE